jgi:hypothetical protein
MASPIFQMRLARVERDRWDEAAEGWSSLAEFVKEAVEEKIARPNVARVIQEALDAPPPKHGGLCEPVRTVTSGGKIFKGPDPKGGRAK